MTIAEIKTQHPADWAALSDQQAAFLTEWISGRFGNGRYNAVDACAVAYPNVKNPVVWASRLLQNKRVARIIRWHLGWSETKSVLLEVQALIKRSRRKGARLDLLVAPWLRVAAALEALAVKESANV